MLHSTLSTAPTTPTNGLYIFKDVVLPVFL
jgi:hypothetical protein